MIDETESMYQRMADKAYAKKQQFYEQRTAREIERKQPRGLPKNSVLRWLPADWITVPELAEQLKRTAHSVGCQVRLLHKRGLLERRGMKRKTEWRRVEREALSTPQQGVKKS